MKIDGNYTFEAPREMVYGMLQDPEVLAKIIPGCEQLTLTGENQYDATLEISVGPVKGKFKGTVQLSNLNPPESYTMLINGQGATGFVKGTGNVRLEEQNNGTLMTYDGDAQVGGRIVSVGQRLLDSAAKALTKQSLDNVNQHIQARIQAQNQPPEAEAVATPPVPEIKAPTQTEFAAGVAKEVMADLVPPNRRPWLVAGAVVGLVILIFLLTRGSRSKK